MYLKIYLKSVSTFYVNMTSFLFQDHVYVYDGIPKFIDSSGNGVLLGAFCGFYTREFHSVLAKSGIITIYFNADISGNCKFFSKSS